MPSIKFHLNNGNMAGFTFYSLIFSRVHLPINSSYTFSINSFGWDARSDGGCACVRWLMTWSHSLGLPRVRASRVRSCSHSKRSLVRASLRSQDAEDSRPTAGLPLEFKLMFYMKFIDHTWLSKSVRRIIMIVELVLSWNDIYTNIWYHIKAKKSINVNVRASYSSWRKV